MAWVSYPRGIRQQNEKSGRVWRLSVFAVLGALTVGMIPATLWTAEASTVSLDGFWVDHEMGTWGPLSASIDGDQGNLTGTLTVGGLALQLQAPYERDYDLVHENINSSYGYYDGHLDEGYRTHATNLFWSGDLETLTLTFQKPSSRWVNGYAAGTPATVDALQDLVLLKENPGVYVPTFVINATSFSNGGPDVSVPSDDDELSLGGFSVLSQPDFQGYGVPAAGTEGSHYGGFGPRNNDYAEDERGGRLFAGIYSKPRVNTWPATWEQWKIGTGCGQKQSQMFVYSPDLGDEFGIDRIIRGSGNLHFTAHNSNQFGVNPSQFCAANVYPPEGAGSTSFSLSAGLGFAKFLNLGIGVDFDPGDDYHVSTQDPSPGGPGNVDVLYSWTTGPFDNHAPESRDEAFGARFLWGIGGSPNGEQFWSFSLDARLDYRRQICNTTQCFGFPYTMLSSGADLKNWFRVEIAAFDDSLKIRPSTDYHVGDRTMAVGHYNDVPVHHDKRRAYFHHSPGFATPATCYWYVGGRAAEDKIGQIHDFKTKLIFWDIEQQRWETMKTVVTTAVPIGEPLPGFKIFAHITWNANLDPKYYTDYVCRLSEEGEFLGDMTFRLGKLESS